jgi:hypothetical protein
MKTTTIIDSIIVLYIILFLYTGISKLMDYSVFKEQIATSTVLGALSKPIALMVPWAEFAVVAMLIIPRWRLHGLYASLSLMIIFTGYIITILISSHDLPCSCGGAIELLSWKGHIVLNSFFIAIALLGIIFQKKLVKDQHRQLVF